MNELKELCVLIGSAYKAKEATFYEMRVLWSYAIGIARYRAQVVSLLIKHLDKRYIKTLNPVARRQLVIQRHMAAVLLADAKNPLPLKYRKWLKVYFKKVLKEITIVNDFSG